MKISNLKKKSNNQGFTIVELIIVIAGLAALSSISIPNFLNSIKLNKIEEAKAIMNGYASDCLGKFRISTDPAEFIENATPDELDDMKLATLGYQIDGEKNKCSHLAIKPANEEDEKLFAFDFRMSSDGLILKTGTPSNNPRFLNSCRGWAGKNCGLSEEQKAEFARIAAIAKAKSECISAYSSWLAAGSSGESLSWDNNNETCTRSVFAFEGTPVNSAEAVEQALKAKYGRACSDWRLSKRNTTSPNGKPETLDPECGGVNYWFHSGNEFTTQAAWNAHDNLIKEQLCIQNRSTALNSGAKGEYTYNPQGPPPCGKVVWFCNGKEYETLTAYKSTSCGTTAIQPPPNDPCKYFTPHPNCSRLTKRVRQRMKGTCVC